LGNQFGLIAKRLTPWAPALIWTTITFIVSHQSVVSIPFGAPDYTAHFINYAVLGVLLIWGLADGKWESMTPRLMLSAVVLAILLGIGDEFHQSFIPGREATVRDVVADAFGASAGACLVALVVMLKNQQSRPT
jgi:VanZ family protein